MKKHWQEIVINGEKVTVLYNLEGVEYSPAERETRDSPAYDSSVELTMAWIEEHGRFATVEEISVCQNDADFYQAMLADIENDLSREANEYADGAAEHRCQSILECKWEVG